MPRAAVPGRPDTIHDLIYPSHGYRDELRRQGIKPHDHARDNRRYIKELQAKIAERKLAIAEAAKAGAATPRRRLTRSASCVMPGTRSPVPRSGSASARSPAPAAKKNFYAGKPHQPTQQVTRTGKTAAWVEPPLLVDDPSWQSPARRAPLPARGGRENQATQASPATDFVAKNIAAAAACRPRNVRSAPPTGRALTPRAAPLGKLPSYLIDRKLEIARIQAEEAANALPPGVPPNHRILPKVFKASHAHTTACAGAPPHTTVPSIASQSVATSQEDCVRVLEQIRASRVEVEKELDCFPFVIDTPTQKARHSQLLKELKQLETAEEAFSRKRVVVADDFTCP